MWSVIFIEGFNAYRGGIPRTPNPYKRFGDDAQLVWERGWDRAEVSNAERLMAERRGVGKMIDGVTGLFSQ